jgi:hypothetical protein
MRIRLDVRRCLCTHDRPYATHDWPYALATAQFSRVQTLRPPSLVTSTRNRYPEVMGEHIERPGTEELSRIARKRPVKPTTEAIGRRLLEIVVYGKGCRIGGTLTLGDLVESEIGDWKMPDFSAACSYAASQGWLIVQDDGLTLTTAGLAAA